MHTKDLITIGVTCYNAEETVQGALESALGQTFPNIEIVVVDDCSLDGSLEKIEYLAALHSGRIKVFRNDHNLGVAGSRNRIISEAKGEFIAFFDDDDFSIPDRVLRQYLRIVDYEEHFAGGMPVICHAARLQCYPDGGERICPTIGCDVSALAPNGDDVVGRILYNKKINGGNGAMPTCSQMARTKVYKDVKGFDENFRRMEDTELNLRLAMSGAHFIGISEPLVAQKMTLANDKNVQAERKFSRMLYTKHRDVLISHGRGGFDLDWLEAKHDYWESNWKVFFTRIIKLFFTHPYLSFQRLIHSIPNLGYNSSFRRLHAGTKKESV